jgi:hypothetical protein
MMGESHRQIDLALAVSVASAIPAVPGRGALDCCKKLTAS